MNNNTAGTQGVTEDDIAQYLVNTPAFFERHAELMASVQLKSPHSNRAVSLHERQMEMLRERMKGVEHRIMDMLRNGQENEALFSRLHRFTLVALQAGTAHSLVEPLLQSLRHEFLVPQATLRLWGAGVQAVGAPHANAVSADAIAFAESLAAPYVGLNTGFEAAAWLDEAAGIQSLALVPLRQGVQCVGLLVLGSPDATRYTEGMGTEFLVRIADITAAALQRVAPAAGAQALTS